MIGVTEEFEGIELGDARLSQRAVKIAGRLAAEPDKSFPKMTSDGSELEALYRFLNNDRVKPELVLAGHYEATAARAASEDQVLVIHDTTGFSFGGETRRKGLGRMKKASAHHSQGFYWHAALVASADAGVPLGLIGMKSIFRTAPPTRYPDRHSERFGVAREFQRWPKLVEETSARLVDCRAIHVMDREADAYALFCKLTEKDADFVIRSKDDRILDVPRGDEKQPRLLHDAIEQGRYVTSREVALSTKRPDKLARLRKAPGRMMRLAQLELVVTQVSIRHPSYTGGKSRRVSTLPRAIPLNVVHVYEANAPHGQQPVDWLLLTTLPVKTAKQAEFVVDCYRRRWLIEEYFKALKTGCAFEKRQLESKHALLNALALFAPIAWRLLTLRNLGREAPDTPASPLLSLRQLQILRARAKVSLSRKPTIREAMLAIAAEGGHIKNNGDPGWIVLGRGYEKLLHMELGFEVAMELQKK